MIGGILWYLGSTYLQRQQEQRNLASVIAKDQIALKDMKLTGDEIFKLTGRVENHNPEATVARITLEIEVRDCAQRDPAGTCGSVGDLKFPLYVTIPPGEARAVAAYGRLPSRRHVRELDWSYRIGEVVAAEEPRVLATGCCAARQGPASYWLMPQLNRHRALRAGDPGSVPRMLLLTMQASMQVGCAEAGRMEVDGIWSSSSLAMLVGRLGGSSVFPRALIRSASKPWCGPGFSVVLHGFHDLEMQP